MIDPVVRRRVLAVTLAVALAVGVGACGSSNSASSPQAVQTAIKDTAQQSGLELTVTLHGQLSDFSNSSTSGSSLTAQQKQAILNSSLALTVHAANGTSLANAGTGGEVALSLAESGTPLVQLRIVASTLYAQIDLQKLTAAYGLDKGRVGQFSSEFGSTGVTGRGPQCAGPRKVGLRRSQPDRPVRPDRRSDASVGSAVVGTSCRRLVHDTWSEH